MPKLSKRMNMKSKIIITLVLCFLTSVGIAQPFVIDSLFGQNGVTRISLNGNYHLHSKIDFLQNGDFYIFGKSHIPWAVFPGGGEVNRIGLYKVNSCGIIDSSYGSNGRYIAEYNANSSYFINGDQSVYIVGSQGYGSPVLTKGRANGYLDTSFQILPEYADFNLPDPIDYGYFHELEIDTITNKILCLGSYVNWTAEGAEYGALLVSFNSDGTVDTTLMNAGSYVVPIHSATVPGAPGIRFTDCNIVGTDRFLLTGYGTDMNLLVLAMVNKNGYLDSTFGMNGIYLDSTVTFPSYPTVLKPIHSEILEDNAFIATQEIENNQYLIVVRKFNLNGELDSTFGINGKLSYPISGNLYYPIFQMKPIFENKILVSNMNFYYNGQVQYTTNSNTLIIDQTGLITEDYDFIVPIVHYIDSNVVINDIVMELDSTFYVACSNIESQLMLIHITRDNLVPHLTIEENTISSNVISANAIFEWKYNGIIVEDQTSSTIPFLGNGQYIVSVTNQNSCGYLNDSLTINTVNLKEATIGNYSLYPNPSNDFLYVDSKKIIHSIEVYDVFGKLVISKNENSNSSMIDVKELCRGTYFIKVNQEVKNFIIY
jgi:hypothetical protein